MSDDLTAAYMYGVEAGKKQFTLTDEEREAIASAIRWCEIDSEADGDIVSRYCAARAATLRGLLERTVET